MTKGDIYAFCQHVRKRQEENGTTDAFRFVKYHNGKEMVNADYGTRSGEQRTAARPSEARQGGQLGKKKKGADKGKQRQQSSQSDEEETDTAPVQRGATPSNISQDADIVDRIDPALLAMNQTGTQQGQQGQATVANNRLGSALENPAVTTDAAGQHAAAGPNTIVTQRQMEVLTTNGHEAVLPLNGPNEGLPLYQVHSIATELFSGAAPHSLKKGIAIEPGLRPKLRTTKKRVRNADKQTIEEAKKLGIRPAGTRANARTRRG
jgi:hypothetical protein